ncbi:MAG TPA: BolA family protein [Caulobacteraceae bacterium]|jgi:BolA protein
MAGVAQRIEMKLRAAFSPSRLELSDESARHAGHAHGGVESHFNLTIESAAFAGVSRLARQRLVMGALADELAGPVHALSIRALAPGEA